MAVTAVLLVLAAWGMLNQRTNYDMMSYLPQDLDSTKGFTILNDDFGLGNTMQVYIRGESDAKVATLAKELQAVKGVEAVHWVTDLAPIEQPREFLDKAVADNYYSDGGTLLQVGFAGTMSDPLVKDAVNEVKRLIEPYDAAITGAQQIELEESMSSSQLGLVLASIGLVTLVLLLTVPSIVVPILFVITIAIGVVMNLGLSYYIGQEVFYLTSVIVFALQFAVTMDYALFLYHRFEEERRSRDTEDAMITAVQATFKAVMAAALTTIAGFLALTFMRLSFGMDLGLTLARGVAMTLLLVVCFLPGLLIDALPLIQKVQHPIPRFDFSRLGRFVARHAGVVALVAVVLLGLGYYGNSRVVESYDIDAGMPTDLPSIRGEKEIAEAFGRANSAFLVLEDTGSAVDLERLRANLEKIDGVTRVFGYTSLVDPKIPKEFLPPEATATFFSDGYTYLMIDLAYKTWDPKMGPALEAVSEMASTQWQGEAYLTGMSMLMRDLETVSAGDADRIDIISIVAILAIVAVAFRSLSVPVALVGTIELAILLNMSMVLLGSGEIIFVASFAIGAIQLGATVDYTVLITTRYEEELARTSDRIEAIKTSVAESSQSIMVSAATMFAATIPLAFMSDIGTVRELTLLIARGALVSFVSVVVFLPAILVVGQPLFERLSIGWPKHVVRGE